MIQTTRLTGFAMNSLQWLKFTSAGNLLRIRSKSNRRTDSIGSGTQPTNAIQSRSVTAAVRRLRVFHSPFEFFHSLAFRQFAIIANDNRLTCELESRFSIVIETHFSVPWKVQRFVNSLNSIQLIHLCQRTFRAAPSQADNQVTYWNGQLGNF